MTDSTADNIGSVTGRAAKAEAAAKAGPVLAADGTPLKKSLNRALRLSKLRAFMLILPLLVFILVTFIAPIADMLFRSVENEIVSDTLPRTVVALEDWDASTGAPPDEAVFEALYNDLFRAVEAKEHTVLGGRLNYELTGMSSLFRKSGRRVDDMGAVYQDQFEDLDEFWEEAENWNALMGSADWLEAMAAWDGDKDTAQPPFELRDGLAEVLPQTAEAFTDFAVFTQVEDDKNLARTDPWELVYSALYTDLAGGADVSRITGSGSAELQAAATAVADFETVKYTAAFEDVDEDWVSVETWETIRLYAPTLTSGYFLNSVDMQKTPEGAEMRPENEQIYITLFMRTLYMSLAITGACILLGYPVAWILANLPAGKANLLMILVLLPFWTSLLVRTSAWKVMLQQQGVVNDTLVWYHSTFVGKALDPVFTFILNIFIFALNAVLWLWNLISGLWGAVDIELFTWAALGFERLALINNVTGTIIAMTHILLPFMILPLYSVMATIPPSYMRAAKSLGATNATAFWRVYFPQSVPGIGAGSILVFILAIGYYITPEIVGGTKGVFISNRIAFHISSSLNWGLAAALGSILLAAVLILYWAYDRIVGIDNVKLGG
ncbi:MAG: ABC transporter permease [Pseudomonadota bacterium]